MASRNGGAGGGGERLKVVIGIKAYNEEANIARCLESALAALAPYDGEVILADSGSSDRTIEIASGYPVRIVQLIRPEDRGCGAGAQLAFQYAEGDYFYLLDGDMTIAPDFLPAGIAHLQAHPELAGVGGRVIEQNLEGEEFQVRAQKERGFEGLVNRLDCGGLYRMEALRSVGHFADRNLHAFEEFELGARLAAKGWKLARIDRPGVNHFGHTTGGYRLLWRRLRTGYSDGLGEVLRAAVFKAHLPIVLLRLRTLQMAFVVLAWWAALIAVALSGAWKLLLGLLVLPLVYFALRRRSFALGLYSFTTCNVLTIGLIGGLVRRRVAPSEPLPSKEISAL